MASEDFYSILGLSRDATKDDIRSAHRRLARELHPDMNKAPDAAKRFAKVQEAYDTLSDEDKRKVYDRVGHDAFVATGGSPGGGGGGGWPGGGRGRGAGGQTYTWTNAGGAPHSDPFNQQDIGDIFEEMFGVRPEPQRGRARPGARRAQTQRPEPPEDIEQEVVIPFDLMLSGGKWDVTTPSGETIEVAIPRGVNDGGRLRLRGKGGASRPGAGAPGDLLLRIRVAPHPRYERSGNDITAALPLSIVEATLGGKVSVRTPGDGHVDLTVPPGTPSGARMRIRGKGVETAKGERGDFYAVVKIVPPKDLSDKDQKALKDLGERIGHPERE